jgi:hypothetical protein
LSCFKVLRVKMGLRRSIKDVFTCQACLLASR